MTSKRMLGAMFKAVIPAEACLRISSLTPISLIGEEVGGFEGVAGDWRPDLVNKSAG